MCITIFIFRHYLKQSLTHKIRFLLFLSPLRSAVFFVWAAGASRYIRISFPLLCLAHQGEGLVRDIRPELTATTCVVLTFKACAGSCIVQHTVIVADISGQEFFFLIVCVLWCLWCWWCGLRGRMPHIQSFTIQLPVLKWNKIPVVCL